MIKMKMKKEHFDYLKKAIQEAKYPLGDKGYGTIFKTAEEMKQNYKNLGVSMKRYRWDLVFHTVGGTWINQNLYTYLNDDHIDTAMRKITNTK
jgi:hypothetical protein